MKALLRALTSVAVVVLDYYGLHWALIGLSDASDLSFVAGLTGIVLIAFINVKLVLWAVKKGKPDEKNS